MICTAGAAAGQPLLHGPRAVLGQAPVLHGRRPVGPGLPAVRVRCRARPLPIHQLPGAVGCCAGGHTLPHPQYALLQCNYMQRRHYDVV